MKKIFLPLLAMIIASACVDDYTDANPPPLVDAPTMRISENGDAQALLTVPQNRFQNANEAYVLYNTPATFTVSVIDAPGGIGEVDVVGSVPDYGTITIDESSVAAIQGQESGTFNFTFTPNPALTPDEERSLNITVSVSDSQLDEDGEAAAKTATQVIPTTIVDGCLSAGLESGYWMVTEASGNLDGGETFNLDTLKKYGDVQTVFVELNEERPGLYTLNEVTAGVWPIFYSGRANPEIEFDLCGTTIDETVVVGELRRFFVDGTVNGDGSITITWSYERADATPTPVNPAKGTYTITPM